MLFVLSSCYVGCRLQAAMMSQDVFITTGIRIAGLSCQGSILTYRCKLKSGIPLQGWMQTVVKVTHGFLLPYVAIGVVLFVCFCLRVTVKDQTEEQNCKR